MMIVIAGLLLLLPAALGVVQAVQANARARAAADLGAIAASSAYVAGTTPEAACAAGGRIVRGNDADVVGCVITASGVATILTSVEVRLPVIGWRRATGRALAGPVLARASPS